MTGRHAIAALFFLSGIILALFVVPEFIYQDDRSTLQEVARVEQRDREALFRELFTQSQSSQRNLTDDYTFWDDMIRFVNGTLGDQWGEENLNTGIASFHLHGIWVMSRTGAVRYGVVGTPKGDAVRDDRLPIPFETIRDSVSRDTISEFYRRIGDTTYVVMAAGIVPTADAERATPPQGYLLTLSAVDDALLDHIENSTGTEVALLSPDAPETPSGLTDETAGTYVFWHPLGDEQGERVGVLRVERSSETIATLASQVSRNRISNRLAFIGLWTLLAVVVMLLDRARVRANAHADELQHDIEQRKKTEGELRARTEELERTNKAMIARELRMVELKRELTEKAPPKQ